MMSPRMLDPARLLAEDEIAELVDYLKSDCHCGYFSDDRPNQAAVPDTTAKSDQRDEKFDIFRNSLGDAYPKYVDQFAQALNEDATMTTARFARVALRKLLASHALPKCQMYAMCNYVLLCAGAQEAEKYGKSFIDRRAAAAIHSDSTRSELKKLQKALEDEECTAMHLYGFPTLNKELRSVMALMMACMAAIEEIQEARKLSFSLMRVIRYHALLRRMAREFFLNPGHPEDSRATGAVAEVILPMLHKAIIGKPPSKSVAALYRENNTQRDKLRFAEEKTQAKLDAMVNEFNQIIPGFSERIEWENLRDMLKKPLTVPMSPSCQEIIMLTRFHEDCVRTGNIQGFMDAIECLLKVMKGYCGVDPSAETTE